MVAALHSSDGPNIRFKWGEGAADGVRICAQKSNVVCKCCATETFKESGAAMTDESGQGEAAIVESKTRESGAGY